MFDFGVVIECSTRSQFNALFPICFFPKSLLFPQQTSPKDTVEEMERLFLQISFDAPPPVTPGADEPVKTQSAGAQFAATAGLRKKMEESLLCVADNLLSCYSPDVSRTCATSDSDVLYGLDSDSSPPFLRSLSRALRSVWFAVSACSPGFWLRTSPPGV